MKENIYIKNPIPILRIFDVEKAKEFYIKILEYEDDWEHSFDESLPLYIQVSKGNCILHLSEHHGDCSPGAAIRMEVDGGERLHSMIMKKKYKFAKPEIEQTPWQTKEFQIIDPFGNKLIFYDGI